MKKLAIFEFGCRSILYLIFESLSICCLYQKRLIKTMCYSKMVEPNILLRKLKQGKKKRKKKEVQVKHQCRNDKWWRDMWSRQSTFDLWKKIFYNFLYWHSLSALKSLFWNFITVLKLLRALKAHSKV